MLAYFCENEKMYIGKVSFISYIAVYFSKKNHLVKLKNVKGLEEYAYYPRGKYVLCNINDLHFYH